MSPPPIVHIVDDNAAVRDAISVLLRIRGFTVRDYPSAQTFLDEDPQGPGCLLTDIQMPGIGGLDLLGRLRERGRTWPAIVMTGRAERRMAEMAAAHGAAFVNKPFAPDEIVAAVNRAMADLPKAS